MRELEKIKKERAEEAARIEAQKKLLEDRESAASVLGANPLLRLGGDGKAAAAGAGDATVKRRCDCAVLVVVAGFGSRGMRYVLHISCSGGVTVVARSTVQVG